MCEDPVVLAEASKVLREVASTMGLIHAFEQGADGKEDFDDHIPISIFNKARTLEILRYRHVLQNWFNISEFD